MCPPGRAELDRGPDDPHALRPRHLAAFPHLPLSPGSSAGNPAIALPGWPGLGRGTCLGGRVHHNAERVEEKRKRLHVLAKIEPRVKL